MANRTDELARARLAFIAASKPEPAGPKRANAVEDYVLRPTPAVASWRDRIQLTSRQILVVALLLACGVAIAIVTWFSSAVKPVSVAVQPIAPPSPSSASTATNSPSSSAASTVKVHVMGGVQRPGVVTLPRQAIVQDAISAAGGLSNDATPGELNLAAPVAHGQQIIVGVTGGKASEVRAPGNPGHTSDSSGDPGGGSVNLNSATVSDLQQLPGVGPVTAEAIIQWREAHGPFKAVADLKEVSGIGPKSFAKLETLVTV